MYEDKQLVEGSQERAYWAHGYMTALYDVLQLFAKNNLLPRNRRVNRNKTRYAA